MRAFYIRFVKRFFGYLLCGYRLWFYSRFLSRFPLWIKADSRGPVLFKQRRIGKGKRTFQIMKFRTMRADTPNNVPTHLLQNPEQYIMHSGRFCCRSSLDELPQLFNILAGHMSLIGPRSALWNQTDLIAERDRYGANDVTPG